MTARRDRPARHGTGPPGQRSGPVAEPGRPIRSPQPPSRERPPGSTLTLVSGRDICPRCGKLIAATTLDDLRQCYELAVGAVEERAAAWHGLLLCACRAAA
jgi:hypothetical protein